VSEVRRESAEVISLYFSEPDGKPLPASLPGQHVVLKFRTKPDQLPVLRSYSLSGAPDGAAYRIGVKQEQGGVASTFIHSSVNTGDTLEVSAPAGDFIMREADTPVVLASAGIAVTPMLAASFEVWWLHGARDGEHRPFAEESRQLLAKLPRAPSYIAYKRAWSGRSTGTGLRFSGAPGHPFARPTRGSS
jgi:ferredoxin-NADP reductase